MPSVIETSSWDAIESTIGDVVIILPPIPRPRIVLVAADAVYLMTDGLPIRLLGSEGVRRVVAAARTLVVSEAHEHIVRETLLQVATTNHRLDGEDVNDLAA